MNTNSSSLFVVDDFYNKPDKIRKLALGTEDYINDGFNYESRKLFYSEEVITAFEKIIGEEIIVDPKRSGFGTLAFNLEGDQTHRYTHYDGNTWAAIVYLVPNEITGNGGLTICRHKDSGLTGPPDQEWLVENNFDSFEEWKETVYNNSQTDLDAWETTMFIPMRYNRLVIKEAGKIFHRGTEGFGTNAGDSRLMHRFFFETKK
ncbi:DUF6445 family protein [Halobacillus sp. A1]|uniref:DUF6445 family protein n=1 Tax=Halobacillus sp. A1 TaxID=2880262 RepID=UPI0020A657C6|nr:DUF6445 family protein [Halobacillus sp. A1]MCP3033465.1 DUF6445 family protein [Halobacillus sp. A1]